MSLNNICLCSLRWVQIHPTASCHFSSSFFWAADLFEVIILLWAVCLQKQRYYTNFKNLTPDTPDRESKKIWRVCSVGFSSMGTTGLRRVLSQREEVGKIPVSSWVLSAIFICSQIFQWMAYIFLPLRRVVFFSLQSYNIPMLSSRTNIRKVFNLFYLRQVLRLLNKLLWFKRWQ